MSASAPSLSSDYAVIDQFVAAMREQGIEVDEPIIADGKLHRYHVVGDRRSTTNAWAILHIDAHPAGKYGCNKRYVGEQFRWRMEGTRTLTAEERRDMKETAKLRAAQKKAEMAILHHAAARRALALYEAGVPVESHPYLTLKGVPSSPRLRVGNWYYINEDTGEEILISDQALLVPIQDRTLAISSLQAILPERHDEGGFRKQYLKNGVKEGKFFAIGRPIEDTLLICEGVATGLSLWQCTGHGVIVAFDAGNIIHVAKEVRKVRPSWRILICADNDQWTEKPVKNPGVHFAKDAALAVKAAVAIPEFLSTDSKPTDFNDLHQLEGEKIVKEIIARALASAPAATDVQTTMESPGDLPPGTPPAGGGEWGPATNPYFQILGYNYDRYFIYQFEKRQVLEYSVGALNDGGFIQLADPNWWETNFRASNGGIDKKGAMNFIMRTANARGIFDVSKKRGRGAWLDDGRHVFHHGQYLTVEGEKVDCTKIQSRYIYQLAPPLDPPAAEPLSDKEGSALIELASMFRWTKPGSAPLLMGWIALAPLCGAIRWRPHIWITGNAGCGKSTILEHVINKLLHGMNLYAQGNSTEAGLRQTLGGDALPVIFDESEQNEDRDVNRVQSVLSLMRQASTESQAQTFKGTTMGDAQHFHIRSMFCLSSIQVGVRHQADTERISILTLRPALKTADAAAQWEAMRDQMHERIGRDLTIHSRLFRRSLDMLPVIIRNIGVFTSVASRIFKSQRAGDQYGTLMAGAYGLMRTAEASIQDAEDFINMFDWSDHVEESDNDEGQRAMQGLLGALIRAPKGVDLTVYEILKVAQLIPAKGVELEPDMALALLSRYGMKIVGKHLLLSNSSNELRTLMADTFKADWRGVLLRIPGVDRNENKPVRMNGVMVKVTRIDLSTLFDGAQAVKPYTKADDERGGATPEIPF